MNFLVNIAAKILDFFYSIGNDYGVAFVLFAVVSRIILFPLIVKIQKDAKRKAILRKRLDDIQFEYRNDSEKMKEEIHKLRSTEYFPITGAYLLVIIQIPLFIILYRTLHIDAIGNASSILVPWLPNLLSKDNAYILPIVMTVSRIIIPIIKAYTSKVQLSSAMIFGMLFSSLINLMFIRYIPAGIAIYCITVSSCAIVEYQIIKKVVH